MLHTTEIGDVSATWRIVGDRIAMESLTDRASHRAAYGVLTDGAIVDAPAGTPGTVHFGQNDTRPDLVQVRDWFPKHVALWDAVRSQYWDAVLPLDHPRFRGLNELATMLYHR
ncbi:hypothetical protein AB0N05_24615 [Nocardia sp. NPDC051030]|uniref:hypothetical protein n=1 Tax=Nocardia sp. NPDC051030 TaxID=3155162 RepID=UPI00343D8488